MNWQTWAFIVSSALVIITTGAYIYCTNKKFKKKEED